MCWFGILGVFIAFHNSTYAAKYSVSGYSTEWLNANCTKAAPILSYNNFFFEVNKTSTELPTSEVWIGYFEAKVPFYYHGCAVVQNEPTYRVTRIGFCKSICVNTTLFGIQAGVGQDIVNPTEGMNCRCVDKNIDEIALGKCGGKYCSQDCYSIFSQFTDPSEIIDIKRATWTEGNADCLNDDMYPATVASIKNTWFEPDEEGHYYWTGIVRARTVLREDSTGEQLLTKTDLSDVSYGFLDGNTGALHFTSNGTKQALCASEGRKDVTQATEGLPNEGQTTIKDVTESTGESLAIGIGIGVSVAVVVGVVVIIVLRQRKVLPCLNTVATSNIDTQTFENGPEQSYEDLVDRDGSNTNYSVLDIHIDSADDSARYYNI